MKKIFYALSYLVVFSNTLCAQNLKKKAYTLEEMIDLAKEKSLSSKIAKSTVETKYYQFNSFNAALKPQLSLTGNLIDFSRDYFGVRQPDGSLTFQSRAQNLSSFGLGLTQFIKKTGGSLSVNSQMARFDDFQRSQFQYNAIPININLVQPLFSFNSYKWDRMIEPLKYSESKKTYKKDIENISLQTERLFFNVIDAQQEYKLAKRNMEYQSQIYEIENRRIALGTTTKSKILQIRLQLLKSKQDLAKAELNIKSSFFNLNNFIGIKDTIVNELILPENFPALNINIDSVISKAKKNRAEFMGFERRHLEAQKDLDMAKKDRFKTNLALGFGLNNTATAFPKLYQNNNTQQTFSIGVQLPILDWGRTKEKIKVAESNLKLVDYSIEQEEFALINELKNIAENMELIYNSIDVAKQADQIAEESFELATEQYRFGKVSINDLNIASQDKDNAKRAYVSSLRNFWDSYFLLNSLML